MNEDFQSKLYELLCTQMRSCRAGDISEATVRAISYYQVKFGKKIDLDKNLSDGEVRQIISELESDSDYNILFKGFKNKIRCGFQRLCYIWNEKVSTSDYINSDNAPSDQKKDEKYNNLNRSQNEINIPEYIKEEHHKKTDRNAKNVDDSSLHVSESKEEISVEKKEIIDDFKSFSRKIYDVLEKYPDVGLIAEQILDLTGQEYHDVKTVTEILKNAAWVREKKKRYYFVSLENYVEPQVTPDVIDSLESQVSASNIDEEAKMFMSDPEGLLKYLFSKRNKDL